MSPSNSSAISEKYESTYYEGTGDAIIDIDSRTTTLNGQAVSLQKYPLGYPQQAAFQSSEPSWSIYRSFDYLHSRVILDLQDELRCLEEQLEDIDLENEGEGRLRSRKDDLKYYKEEGLPSPRALLLETIRNKLVNYDEILAKARDLNTFQRPSNRDYRSFRIWYQNKKPLNYEREEQFIKRREDLVSLRQGREWSGFDGFVETCIRKLHCKPLHWLFATKELREKTDDKHVFFYSHHRIEKLVGLVITFIIFILLILPVVAMYNLTSIGNRDSTLDAVGILVVFTLLFSAAMSLLTKAKRHELFAASAAYCAVLVVFISNFNNGQGPGSL
ncbi:hypothetical protein SLS60_003925 [Paraconiothyrium brasiliense]|uniref:DUF6594 domain-containing protein n=1 Tax=Paraconiothyrium brasiliense TaxID=300254 RepID=A0ABR3RQ07_9PLEO